MKHLLFILLLLVWNCALAQTDVIIDTSTTPDVVMNDGTPVKGNCYCNKGEFDFTIDCDTTVLSNGRLLFYQLNCDDAWLTLQTKDTSVIICSMGDLGNLSYRLGHQLIREYNRGLLFRHGCPANGPCEYSLLDKETGNTIKDYGMLIDWADSLYSYVVYFGDALNKIYVEDVETGEKVSVKVHNKHFQYPQLWYQFNDAELVGNTLNITYADAEDGSKPLNVIKVVLPQSMLRKR